MPPESARLSLRKNLGWMFVATVVYNGCQWGMIAALAKTGPPSMVGDYVFALAVCAPIVMFANLQLRKVQATDASAEYEFGDYFAVRLFTTLVALLVITAIAVGRHDGFRVDFVILLVGIAKALESFADLIYGSLQQHERMDRIAQSQIRKGPLLLIAMIVGVVLTGDLHWALLGVVVAHGITLAAFDIPAVLQFQTISLPGLRAAWRRPRRLLSLGWLSLPFGVATGLISLRSSMPRYFIQSYLGVHALGIYGGLAYLTVAGDTANRALVHSAIPRFAILYATRNLPEYFRLLGKAIVVYSLLGISGVVIAYLAGRPLLTLLYTPEYASHVNVLVCLAAAFAIHLLGQAFHTALTALRNFWIQLSMAILDASCLALFAYLLVPTWGLMGAAWSVLLTEILDLLLSSGFLVVCTAGERKRSRLRDSRLESTRHGHTSPESASVGVWVQASERRPLVEPDK
ncbi:MAG: lipopolysaccharide biosynthesis protein [Luteitalea sp.]|nr:lipopolysaccharide biosynthesis protein [Luteitalea sp.]